MTSEIRIIGLNIIFNPKVWNSGDKLLAHFDCEVRGFRMERCLLIKGGSGAIIAMLPRNENEQGAKRAIRIIDGELSRSLADAAHKVYLEFGGTEISSHPRQAHV